jgi:iron complex transport system ATP-binding protein
MTPLVRAEGLSIRIGGKLLVDRVSLSIGAGETIAVVGPNGAGKSTLLRALAGEIAACAGSVALKGHALDAIPPRELALHRAVLSQNTVVSFPFSVAEVVGMGWSDGAGRPPPALIGEALAAVGLDGWQGRVIGTLSGGEQQRVHFARALMQVARGERAHGPGVLLLDEPTASLDLRHQLDIVAAAQACAARGVAVVAVVHDLNLAALWADRVLMLAGGRVVAQGSPERTITEAMVRRVFGVASAVSQVPSDAARPFVLPHGALRCDVDSAVTG